MHQEDCHHNRYVSVRYLSDSVARKTVLQYSNCSAKIFPTDSEYASMFNLSPIEIIGPNNSALMTDASVVLMHLGATYDHRTVGEYMNSMAHMNRIESFWAISLVMYAILMCCARLDLNISRI